ncbi:MAG: GTP pyrophosphokinase [Acidobacteria bacterium]|nr:GTP pyrophosphokinase [Acidobacteriota bacterium]MCB9396836.1 GTP pyrophosphokinase [Acidobacteriota bacterium]
MSWETLLAKAIAVAATAHQNQFDRSGKPYILHPLRMMFRLEDPRARIAAVLHDVVEDTPISLADLGQAGFPEEILTAVDALTKREGEPYETFVQRAAVNPIARQVKIADLEDNMDLKRLNGPISDKDKARLSKYHSAWQKLKSEA